MDMIQVEIGRARLALDKLGSGTDVEVYRALDSLWQVMYLMWLDTIGVIRSPQEQDSRKFMYVTAEQLAEMGKSGSGARTNPETKVAQDAKKKDGYL